MPGRWPQVKYKRVKFNVKRIVRVHQAGKCVVEIALGGYNFLFLSLRFRIFGPSSFSSL